VKRLSMLAFLLAGCSWSNSLYNARRLSESALKADREERTFDAGSLWGQVAVRADSAYRRDPSGDKSTEALWLRGRAVARLGDCEGGVPLLERARSGAGDADWRDDLNLELARCRLLGGDPEAALQLVTPLLTSTNDDLRVQARSLAGRSLMRAEQWEAAREFLAEDETVEGTWLHAMALARLGRSADALKAVEGRIAIGDSVATWDDLFRALASTPGNAGVSDLRSRLTVHRWATDTVQQRWDLATAETMMSHDSAVATLMLERIVAGARTPSASRARMLLLDQMITQASDDTTLGLVLGRIEAFGRSDPSILFPVQRLVSWGRAMRADLDSTRAGAPDGDMMLFFHATVARDTLESPRLASWLLARLERDWPASPYVPKALLARMQLEPDSLDALRARFESHSDSPYLAFVQGRESGRFAELEWALDFYLGERFANTMSRGEQ
jgi:hypothetical protein